MRNIKKIVIASCLLLSACAHEVEYHGYSFEQHTVSLIKVGKSSQYNVLHELGSPTTQSDFGDKVFYYINYKTEKTAFFDPKIIEQRVLAITFDNKGIVKDIQEFTMDNYRDISFAKHKTELKGSSLTPIEQVLSNIGKHNKKQKQF